MADALHIDKDFEWINDFSPEMIRIIAVRSALRALPCLPGQVLPSAPVPSREQIEALIVSVFRALSAAWAISAYPAHGDKFKATAQVASSVLSSFSKFKLAACDAAFSASFSASTKSLARAKFEAINAIKRADIAIHSANAKGISLGTRLDIDKIKSGATETSLAQLPLWRDAKADWSVGSRWASLRQTLLGVDDSWSVWIDWYERRLEGQPSPKNLELSIAEISEELWGRGPKAINEHIRRLLAERQQRDQADPDQEPSLDDIPPQSTQALVFGGDEDVPIALVDPPGEGIRDTPDQRQSYSDIFERSQVLESSCGISNRLAPLKSNVSKLLISMGDSLVDLRVRSFWTQMNSMRHRLEVDLRVRESNDPECPALPEEVAGILHDLVDSLNIFAAHEHRLVLLDELKRDPSKRVSNEETLTATRDISEAAMHAPQIVEPKAAGMLADVVAETDGTGPSSDRAREFSTKSARNLVLEALRRTYKGIVSETGVAWKGLREGAYRLAGGATLAYGLALFIKANETAVRALLDTLGGVPLCIRSSI